ncbi:MAG: DUF4493 domain-containing protein [Bacteroidales bacterium]|nr:DUF4493 domain-containing protein [Candidatus Cacconaster merdequi]
MQRLVKMGYASICLFLAVSTGCTWEDSKPAVTEQAKLVFNFINTKVGETNPDDFFLRVYSTQGDSCYAGKYGERPSEMSVKPGSYIVSVFSEFDGPSFGVPQYGDEVSVTVKKQEKTTVDLYCTMINSGLVLSFTDAFLKEYPSYPIVLSQDGRSLEYPADCREAAYFNPGKVFFTYNDEVLLYKELTKGQIRKVTLDAVQSSAGMGITIHIDADTPVIEEEQTVEASTFSVSEAKLIDNGLVASVSGYIVGAVKNSKFICASAEGFDVSSNIVISASPQDTSLDKGMPVELKGSLKSQLNLVDNPELCGKRITIKGTLMPYFGVKGLKNVTLYEMAE